MSKNINAKNLKIFAIVLMIINHFFNCYFLHFEKIDWLNKFQINLTRASFIIFAFLVAEGISKTKSKKKYLLRLLVFALISEIPADLCLHNSFIYWEWQNVFWTFSLSVLASIISDKLAKGNITDNLKEFMIFIIIAFISEILKCDYGFGGVMIVWTFKFSNNIKNKKCKVIMWIALFITWTCFNRYIDYLIKFPSLNFDIIWPYYLETIKGDLHNLLAIPFLLLYNGQRGNIRNKYLFYAIYPIHLAVIYFLFVICCRI